MKNKNIYLIIFVCTLSLSLTLPLFALQIMGTGRLNGSVEDEQGNPLEGVKIVIQNLKEKNLTLKAESNEKGKWYVVGLIKGKYSIAASKKGYESVYCEMELSQFASKNPLLNITMKKIVAADMQSIMDESSISFFKEGNELFKQGKYAQALAKFKEFLENNNDIYQVNLNIGNCYREMGDYGKAIAAYNKILEKAKKDESTAKALSNIGEIYLNQGNIEKAKEYFKQAVDIFPENEIVAFKVGEIFFKQGETDKAIEYFNLAIKIKETWATPYRQLGYAYLNKGEYKLALNSLKKFLELAPDSPEAATIKNLIPRLEELIKK